MTYRRRITHFNQDMSGIKAIINLDTDVYSRVDSAWFELLRQGGCGAGEVTLRDSHYERGRVSVGDWMAFDYEVIPYGRWYLGRVEDIRETTPKGVTISLQGPSIQLSELFPGGFAGQDANQPPHLIAKSDYFVADPDRAYQTWDLATQPYEVLELMWSRFVQPRTVATTKLIEPASPPPGFESLVFRREESVASITRAMANHAHGASWGITQDRVYFMLTKRTNVIATFREGYGGVERFERLRDLSNCYNSIEITGGYIYNYTNGFNRARWHYINFASRATYGERRYKVFLPWLRRNTDAVAFADRFLRTYSYPTERYTVQVRRGATAGEDLPYNDGQSGLPRPWEGQVKLLDFNGNQVQKNMLNRIHVDFNQVPVFTMELGPETPQFSVSPALHRWELPTTLQGPGGQSQGGISIEISGFGSDPSGTSPDPPSTTSDPGTSPNGNSSWSFYPPWTSSSDPSSNPSDTDPPSVSSGGGSGGSGGSSGGGTSTSGGGSSNSDTICTDRQSVQAYNFDDGDDIEWDCTSVSQCGNMDVGLVDPETTQRMVVHSFGDFNIPTDAEIVSVSILANIRDFDEGVENMDLTLAKDGVPGTQTPGTTIQQETWTGEWQKSYTTVEVDFGNTISITDINNDDLEVWVDEVTPKAGDDGIPRVNWVKIKVCYNLAEE